MLQNEKLNSTLNIILEESNNNAPYSKKKPLKTLLRNNKVDTRHEDIIIFRL